MIEVALHNSYVLIKRVVSSNSGFLETRICLVTQLIGATCSVRHVGRPRSADVDLPRLDRMGLHIPIYMQTRTLCKVCCKIVSKNYRRDMLEPPRKIGPGNLVLPNRLLLTRNVRWHFS